MPAGPGTFELLAGQLGESFHVLAERLADGGVEAFFAELGLRPPEGLTEHDDLAAAVATAASAAGDLTPLLDELSDAIAADDLAAIVGSGQRLARALREVVAAVENLASAVDQARAGLDGLSPEEQAALEAFAADLARRALDAMLIDHLAAKAPGVLALADVLGLVEVEPEDGDDDSELHPPWLRRELHLDRLALLLSDPESYGRAVYGWGTRDFDGVELLTRLQRYLEHLGAEALLITPPGDAPVLEAYVFSLAVDDTGVPPRLVASLRFAASEEVTDAYPVRDPWIAETTAEGNFDPDAQVLIDPPLSFRLVPPDGTAELSAGLGLVAERPDEPLLIFGEAQGTRLEADRLRLGLSFAAAWDADAEVAHGRPSVAAELGDGRLVMAVSGADSFLATLLPGELAFDVELAAVWDVDGLRLRGGAGLAVTLPLSQQAGAVALERLDLELGVDADRLALDARASGSVTIGPCRVRIDGVGAAGQLAFTDGNLGPVDLGFGFVAPAGIALDIDAGPVTGGGFLFFDPDEERYAGAVQLDVDGLALSAVGLLTTGLPEDAGRYSLLVLVSAADFAPVNLGFGFTLNAVGGLLGVNRAADTEELRARLRGGGLDALAFPDDPVEGADELAGRLRSTFPPAPGRHLVGPAALIGWGTPTMLTIELVVALELPEPVRLVALAQLRALLPSEDRTLVRLNMDALGVVDFDRGRASLDAVLYDSDVVGQSIGGEMALRARWLGRAGFVLAVGGLNPRYEPPADFPELEPLSLTFERSRAEVRLEAYLALTSNTAQVGARLTVEVSASRFTIDGMLEFDALFEFAPFRFVVDIAGRVRLRWGSRTLAGVYLEMTLAGPVPLHARGKATFKLGPLSLSASFDRTLDPGEPPAPPPPADPLPALLEALVDPRSWSAVPPVAHRSVVSLRQVDGAAALVHPLGELTVRQRVVPLEVRIERYGSRALAGGPRELNLTVSVLEEAPVEPRTVPDHFAPAQFFELDDDDKLSAPAFQPLPSGVRLETPDAAFGGQDDGELMASAPVGYDTLVIDDDGAARDAAAYEASARRIRAAVARRARTLAGSGHARGVRYRGPGLGLRLRDPVYVVARREDLRVDSFVSSGGSDGLSHTAAVQLLRRKQRQDEGVGLQVVARHESVAAVPGLLPPGASPEEPGIYVERSGFGRRVPGARRATMTPDSDPLPPTQAPGRRWQWVAPLDDGE